MPLTPYRRDRIWWVRGRIDYNGRPITGYYRRSTGASSEAGARDWIRQEETRRHRAFLLGEERATLTFNAAVLLYSAKPAEATFLAKILPHLGTRDVAAITSKEVHKLCPKIYPLAAADTWQRQVITPIRAVINNAHDLGKAPAIRIKGFLAQERIEQDKRRGKQSRPPKRAGSWAWIETLRPAANPYVIAGLEFMFETGCRVGQMCAVRPADLDLAGNRIRIIAQKGHPEQWVGISPELVARLANLPARRPKDSKRGRELAPRVFGYETRGGFRSALKAACKASGAEYLTPHEAGRHAFYTELRVRQGVDPISAAHAGRWSDPKLPDRVYAEAEEEGAIRAKIRAAQTPDLYKSRTVTRAKKRQVSDKK